MLQDLTLRSGPKPLPSVVDATFAALTQAVYAFEQLGSAEGLGFPVTSAGVVAPARAAPLATGTLSERLASPQAVAGLSRASPRATVSNVNNPLIPVAMLPLTAEMQLSSATLAQELRAEDRKNRKDTLARHLAKWAEFKAKFDRRYRENRDPLAMETFERIQFRDDLRKALAYGDELLGTLFSNQDTISYRAMQVGTYTGLEHEAAYNDLKENLEQELHVVQRAIEEDCEVRDLHKAITNSLREKPEPLLSEITFRPKEITTIPATPEMDSEEVDVVMTEVEPVKELKKPFVKWERGGALTCKEVEREELKRLAKADVEASHRTAITAPASDDSTEPRLAELLAHARQQVTITIKAKPMEEWDVKLRAAEKSLRRALQHLETVQKDPMDAELVPQARLNVQSHINDVEALERAKQGFASKKELKAAENAVAVLRYQLALTTDLERDPSAPQDPHAFAKLRTKSYKEMHGELGGEVAHALTLLYPEEHKDKQKMRKTIYPDTESNRIHEWRAETECPYFWTKEQRELRFEKLLYRCTMDGTVKVGTLGAPYAHTKKGGIKVAPGPFVFPIGARKGYAAAVMGTNAEPQLHPRPNRQEQLRNAEPGVPCRPGTNSTTPDDELPKFIVGVDDATKIYAILAFDSALYGETTESGRPHTWHEAMFSDLAGEDVRHKLIIDPKECRNRYNEFLRHTATKGDKDLVLVILPACVWTIKARTSRTRRLSTWHTLAPSLASALEWRRSSSTSTPSRLSARRWPLCKTRVQTRRSG